MFKKLAYGASVAALVALAPVAAVHAQQTDATVRGSVVDANGAPVAGATITFLDTRNNAVATATTTGTGNFARTNLRVGGPYQITVSAAGFEPVQTVVRALAIGSNPALNLTLNPAASDVIIVTGARIGNALEIQNGVGTTFTAEDLQDTPLLDRDLTNIIDLDPLVSVAGDSGESGVVSFGGIEPRLNGFTVDGAVIADRFKLEEAFYPTLRQPISFDVIEAVAATYSEYSVLTTGAQGGLVNTVTRSGGNEIDGALFFRYGDDTLQGDETEFGPIPTEADFEETEWGVTVGGPIIEDRLFFLVSYEEYEQVNPDLYNLSQAQLDVFADIRDVFLNSGRYGNFDPGVKTNVIDDTRVSDRFFGKLDWQINDQHRASIWYTNIEESRLQNRGGYEFDFPSQAYDKTTDIDMYLGQIQSDWTDNFSTTVRVVRKESVIGQVPRVPLTNGASDFGTFVIDAGFGRNDVSAGADPFRHLNFFEDESTELFFSGDYLWGDHIITFGSQYLDYELVNGFGQFCRGEFVFDSIADLEAGNASVEYQNIPGNNCADRVAAWGYQKLDLFIQDEWQLSPTFSINYGVRYERFMSDDSPIPQGNFAAEYGADSAGDLDGLDIILPRFGFNWDAPYDIAVQGGVGLFSGGDPVVWFSNAYSPLSTLAFGSVTDYQDFSQIPAALQTQVDANTGPFNYDHISPDFNIPSLWKASVRAERFFDFGPLGEDYLFGVQLAYSRVNDSAAFINRAQLADEIVDPTLAASVAANTGVAPDGRPIYSDARATGDAIQLINTDEGESLAISVSLEKEFDFGLTVYGSYAYTDSERLIPGSSSRHISNYRSLVTTDRNSASPAGTSVFEVQDRFVFTLKYERDFIRDLETQVVLKGVIESGPVSNIGYVHFSNSGNSRIFGRAAGGSPFSGVDLLYVPTPNDPLVIFPNQALEDAFFSEAERLGILGDAGGTVEKNGVRGPWNQRFDLSFTQELPGLPGAERWVGDNRLMFELDIFNVANLLNSEWGGQIDDPRFDTISLVRPSLVTAADAAAFRNGTLDEAGLLAARISSSAAGATCQVATDCVYVYDGVFGGADTFSEDLNDSIWQIRVGLRYEF